jgi:NAD+ kinase
MRVVIFGYLRKPEVQSDIARLRPLIRKYGSIKELDLAQKHDPARIDGDLALVFGGDGTILRAAQQMGYHQIPTLGINLGKLGFLADLKREEAPTVLKQLFENHYSISEHMMFECVVPSRRTSRKKNNGNQPEQTFLGLNELVVHADPPLHMIEIDLSVDNEPIVTFSGDGLILSTPTGSTGHNLSAGGPILQQELQAFVITPICAHALTYRPLIEAGERIFTIALHQGSHPAILSIDGQQQVPLKERQHVLMRQAAVKFKRVRVPGRAYYSTLREKLEWGAPPRYRADNA